MAEENIGKVISISGPAVDVQFNEATILVAGPNFGVGSSREHAVWSLMDYGIKAVISPRFGDIFRNNATKSGLVPCSVDAEAGAAILNAEILAVLGKFDFRNFPPIGSTTLEESAVPA